MSLSIRQAEELSTTKQLLLANFGAQSKETDFPAEKIAMSGFCSKACSRLTTLYSFPNKYTDFPTDFSDATGINSSNSNLYSSKTLSKLAPTIPVTPTTANFISQKFFLLCKNTRFF